MRQPKVTDGVAGFLRSVLWEDFCAGGLLSSAPKGNASGRMKEAGWAEGDKELPHSWSYEALRGSFRVGLNQGSEAGQRFHLYFDKSLYSAAAKTGA